MPLPIKTLPIVERWTCTGCGKCCRGNVVPLHDDDLERLRSQNWDRHPDFQGVRTVVRQGRFGKRYQLAQRDDGTCVFLGVDGLCKIHQEFGFSEKPLVCRMYPLQLVPTDKRAILTLRRSCPTAACDEGEQLKSYRDEVKRYVTERPRLAVATVAPHILPRQQRGWDDALAVTRGLERLLTDQRFPLVRRVVHGLQFCELLQQCRLKPLDSAQLKELVQLLVDGAVQESAEFFRERQSPTGTAQVLFRQAVVEYLRLHPRYQVRETWRNRWTMTMAAMAFARGRGAIPLLHSSFPVQDFEDLESQALGPLADEVIQPLTRYFEVSAASLQYAVASRPGWSLVERFRAVALTHAVTLWMLRYFSDDETSPRDTMIDLVTSVDRGQGYGPLVGRQHRKRIASLASLGQLERLVAWYGR